MNPLRTCIRTGHRIMRGLASRWRNLYYRAMGVRMTGYSWIRRIEIPRNWAAITLEGPVALDLGVVLLVSGNEVPDKLVIRPGTYVNRYTMFDCNSRIEIGRSCMIGPHCYVTDANHGTLPGRSIQSQPMHTGEVVIGDDVWLGAGVKVLAGVHIGSGTVVGAGSVVTCDLPENVIAVGVPARGSPAASLGHTGQVDRCAEQRLNLEHDEVLRYGFLYFLF